LQNVYQSLYSISSINYIFFKKLCHKKGIKKQGDIEFLYVLNLRFFLCI